MDDCCLAQSLLAAGLEESRIEQVIDSGYILRHWVPGPSGEPNISISDAMYGNKAFSSRFEIAAFVDYVRGVRRFEPAPQLRREKVKSLAEIYEVLSEAPRAGYIREGSLTFRGQPREYTFKRIIPNPVRGDHEGREISIMPGVYRQTNSNYSFAVQPREIRSFEFFAREFEQEADPFDLHFSYDLMRTEQHYASQTAGLDVSFDMMPALFFATYRFEHNPDGLCDYRAVPPGAHQGVIYLFRFGMPSVTKTEFLIRDFDFFRTHRPERVLRQDCGLPLIDAYERNIALTEVDCIIELDADFSSGEGLAPNYLFPGVNDDGFYRKLLQLKDRYPKPLSNIVEYRWARN